ncbi:alanine dehydrogenase/pyridine nucleotide transhydrogenase, partial [Blyttiomyces helicus]
PLGTPYKNLTVGIPKEIFPNEKRVAITPENVKLLLKKGFQSVKVEEGAGIRAQFTDAQYIAAGATITTHADVLSTSNIVLKVRAPQDTGGQVRGEHELDLIRPGTVVISFLHPAQNGEIIRAMSERGLTAFAMDQIPRISRAQVFDALRWVCGEGGEY